jgi:flagellin-like protein
MKANQTFRRNDEAVSPVIGVILMVAITVVLAAVVFILVNDLGQSGEDAPDMGFTKNNDACTVTVVKAPSGNNIVAWDNDASGDGDIDVTASVDSDPAGHGVTDGDTVNAGDILQFDTDALITGAQCTGVDVTIRHIGSNTLLYETEFT